MNNNLIFKALFLSLGGCLFLTINEAKADPAQVSNAAAGDIYKSNNWSYSGPADFTYSVTYNSGVYVINLDTTNSSVTAAGLSYSFYAASSGYTGPDANYVPMNTNNANPDTGHYIVSLPLPSGMSADSSVLHFSFHEAAAGNTIDSWGYNFPAPSSQPLVQAGRLNINKYKWPSSVNDLIYNVRMTQSDLTANYGYSHIVTFDGSNSNLLGYVTLNPTSSGVNANFGVIDTSTGGTTAIPISSNVGSCSKINSGQVNCTAPLAMDLVNAWATIRISKAAVIGGSSYWVAQIFNSTQGNASDVVIGTLKMDNTEGNINTSELFVEYNSSLADCSSLKPTSANFDNLVGENNSNPNFASAAPTAGTAFPFQLGASATGIGSGSAPLPNGKAPIIALNTVALPFSSYDANTPAAQAVLPDLNSPLTNSGPPLVCGANVLTTATPPSSSSPSNSNWYSSRIIVKVNQPSSATPTDASSSTVPPSSNASSSSSAGSCMCKFNPMAMWNSTDPNVKVPGQLTQLPICGDSDPSCGAYPNLMSGK
jgi:hypothetical protein